MHFWGFYPICAYKLTSQKLNASECFRRKSVQRAMSFFILLLHLYELCQLGARNYSFRVQVLTNLQILFFDYEFAFTYFVTANCFSVESWIDFWDNLFMGRRKVNFPLCDLSLLGNFGLFFKKTKILFRIWTRHTQILPWSPFLIFLTRKKYLALAKHSMHNDSVMWSKNLDFGLPEKLFHWREEGVIRRSLKILYFT